MLIQTRSLSVLSPAAAACRPKHDLSAIALLLRAGVPRAEQRLGAGAGAAALRAMYH